MTFGVTDTGFNRQRLPEIKEDIEKSLREAFGESVDLRPEGVLGQLVGLASYNYATHWEMAEDSYNSLDPDKATGSALDALSALIGIIRRGAIKTSVTAELYGTQGAVVPAGMLAKNPDTGDLYVAKDSGQITRLNAVGASISVSEVVGSVAYTVTIAGTSYTHTSAPSPSASTILTGLADLINAGTIATAQISGAKIILTVTGSSTIISASARLSIDQVVSQIEFEAQTAGPVQLPINGLTEIVTSVFGIEAIANKTAGITGRGVETDAELRLRRKRSIDFTAQATVSAIYARISNLDGVIDALVLQNSTETTDPETGVPRQHIWAIVQGGDSKQIAQVIFDTVAGGIGTWGDESEVVQSEGGQSYEISFSRPDPVPVYIEVDITTSTDYPLDGDELIKNALVAHVLDAVKIGDSLVYSRLFTPINTVPGHEVTGLRIGTSPTPTGTVTIDAAYDELLTLSADDIIINAL